MAKPSNLFSFCSLLMSIIFAYSASVQFNDTDWYFWFPLYAVACAVNLANGSNSGNRTVMRPAAKSALSLGTFLFLKVAFEHFVSQVAGFWTLDLSKRAAREKIRSLLVIISMSLHLMESKNRTQGLVQYGIRTGPFPFLFLSCCLHCAVGTGMTILAGFSYGLPIVFFVIQNGEMEF